MSMTDPVADFLTRLRNGAKAQHHDVSIPSSKLKRELARILKEQGYIEEYAVHDPPAGRPGQELTITTNRCTDEESFALLEALGMPFAKSGRPQSLAQS